MTEPAIRLSSSRSVTIEVTPLERPLPLIGRVRGVAGFETSPRATTSLYSQFIRPDTEEPNACYSDMGTDDVIEFEQDLRKTALSGDDRILVGLFAQPALESSSGALNALGAGASGAGIYQFMQFPIARFNGIPLPANSRIRFADPSRWFQGGMESRLATISVENTSKFFAWMLTIRWKKRLTTFTT